MIWHSSSKDSAAKASGGPSKQENVLPKGISIAKGPKGKDESDLLVDGDVDALFHAGEPRAYLDGHPKVGRLFPDYRKTERAYFAKTGIFPIMHAVAMHKGVIEANPWLPKAVFNAYSQAKQVAYEDMAKTGWISDMLPWYGQELEETRAVLGDNFYSYGLKSNRKTLGTLFRYSYEQELSSRELTVEELFAPSSLEFDEKMA